jgi:hypothetical protein
LNFGVKRKNGVSNFKLLCMYLELCELWKFFSAPLFVIKRTRPIGMKPRCSESSI